jgi:hypothetical protein
VRCARNDPAPRLATQEGHGGNLAGGLFGAIVSPMLFATSPPLGLFAARPAHSPYRRERFESCMVHQTHRRWIASINGSFRVTFADEAIPGGVGDLGAARILRAKPETTSSVVLFNIGTDDLGGV